MSESRLTVRTLCLATVAFVLACGHAARAMGQQRPQADRVPTKSSSSTIRVVPAGSSNSTVATFSTSGGSGASKVATFTAKTGSGAGGSIVTFIGDKVIRQAGSASHSRSSKPPSKGSGKGIMAPKKDPPMIAVRRPGDPVVEPQPAAPAAPVAPTATAAKVEPAKPGVTPDPAKQAKPQLRNAFGGLLSQSNTMQASSSAGQQRVYAQAAAAK